MPDELTRADSTREYLTGAGSDGGAQASPNAALGNFRASTEAQSLSMVVANAIANIVIEFVGGGNAVGIGTLNAVDANTLRWRCAGGSYGTSVAIANGETKILETDGDPAAFIRVTRTSATALIPGSSTITLSQAINSVFAFDDVGSAEAVAGDTEYRATILVNESALSITDFKRWIGTLGTQQLADTTQLGATGAGTIVTTGSFATWPASGWCHIRNGTTTREIVYYASRTDTTLTVPAGGRARLGTSAAAGAITDTLDAVPGIAIAIDDDGVVASPAAIQTIANENTAPTGVAWVTGITETTGLDFGTMDPGDQVGFWIKREIPAAASPTTEASVVIRDSFNA